ncbi:hypothetical protein Ae201684_002432 [Aphanomyces euteiches]|uniref:Uncharacterized protein n=1 Tax=Aphanomyces euteiches TaxID=100861 RepID=A0A6G0XR08_9STRA|nr:hypothetical protein Ae201684_002432 [Aphanomyces euteiches]
MAKVKATLSSSMKKALDLSSVKFTSQPGTDAFRVQISTTDDDVPLKIWLENKRSKEQWECTVKDVAEHAPRGATYVLPSAVVVTSLLTALSAPTSQANESEKCSVDLKPATNGGVTLVLTMKAFGQLTAEYSFKMTKLEIATTDVLEAKIRDLQEEIAELKEGKLAIAQLPQITQLQTELKELRTNMRSRGYYTGSYH